MPSDRHAANIRTACSVRPATFGLVPKRRCRPTRRADSAASVAGDPNPRFAEREVRNKRAGSFRFDMGRPDNLGSLLGFFDDQLAEVGMRARKYSARQFRKLRLDLGIGKARVDFFVELVDDLGRRAGLALYDARLHQASASSYGNHDASCCAHYYAAMALALAGDEKSSRAMIGMAPAASMHTTE